MIHPNEVMLAKLTEDEMVALELEATENGKAYLAAFKEQVKRQAQ